MSKYFEIQKESFYDASARKRAINIVDEGTWEELIKPASKLTSPHLPTLGQAVSFDDGVVVGVGKLDGKTVVVISQEGKFIGGAVGEIHGAKIVGAFSLAQKLYDKIVEKYPNDIEKKRPAIIWSFETGGVRLHEANAGLLAHAEIMEQIQKCRGKIPVISLIGSKLGCFGGMGFVTVATDCIIMSEQGRIGLTGPEVIEEVMGKKEFDAGNKSLVSRTTGAKHKYIMRDCSFLVKDSIGDFKNQLKDVLSKSYSEIEKYRLIGSMKLVEEQMKLVALAAQIKPKDSMDVWKYFGNENPATLPEMSYDEFMKNLKRRERGGF